MAFETPEQLYAEIEAEREFEKTRYIHCFKNAVKHLLKENIRKKHRDFFTADDIRQRLIKTFRFETDAFQEQKRLNSIEKDFESICDEIRAAGWIVEVALEQERDASSKEPRYRIRKGFC